MPSTGQRFSPLSWLGPASRALEFGVSPSLMPARLSPGGEHEGGPGLRAGLQHVTVALSAALQNVTELNLHSVLGKERAAVLIDPLGRAVRAFQAGAPVKLSAEVFDPIQHARAATDIALRLNTSSSGATTSAQRPENRGWSYMLRCPIGSWGTGDLMALSIEDLAGVYHEAWVGRDPDTIAALHTEDSTFHIHGLTDPSVGRDGVRDLIASLLRLVPDLAFEAKRFYAGSDHIAFEYDMSGTSEGARFVCDGVDVIAVRDGLVARKDTYLDLVALTDQVGVLPHVVAGV